MSPEERARHYDSVYEGQPPWDIDGPQPEIVSLLENNLIKGSVLDVGCGTGENALYLASKGHSVTGIDISSKAIDIARKKARQKGLQVKFLVMDALALNELSDRFDTIIDVGCFHTFSDEDRLQHVKGLKAVLKHDTLYHVICFSDKEPGTWGPRRVSKSELIQVFTQEGFLQLVEVKETTFNTNLPDRKHVKAIRGTFRAVEK